MGLGAGICNHGYLAPVYLQQPDEYLIRDFTFETLSISGSTALVRLKAGISRPFTTDTKININLSSTKFKYKKELIAVSGSTEFQMEIEVQNPELWFPNGVGSPHLYDLEIKIVKDKDVLDEIHKKVGIRSVKLQLTENEKSTFRFIVNGRPLFLKGCNWIPADFFSSKSK